jgi:1,2-dihydroxy-3-keto-5-methylthiopentene dioxygenase
MVQIMADGDAADIGLRTDDAEMIGVELAKRGVVFDHWPTMPGLDAATPIAEILDSYCDHVSELSADSRVPALRRGAAAARRQ